MNPFDELPRTPAEHFRLYFYAAVLRVIQQVIQAHDSTEAAFEQFPFLIGYHNELALHGLEGIAIDEAGDWWRDALQQWEQTADHLPLVSLRDQAGIGHDALTLLLAVGLIEEDTRFGTLYEALQSVPGQHRPTNGLLSAWWDDGRSALRLLRELGLVQVANPEAPSGEWALQLPSPLWDVMSGETREALAPWLRYRPPAELTDLEALILPDAVHRTLDRLPALLASGDAQSLVVRGPHHNGRRTAIGAVARALELGTLEVSGIGKSDDERWRLVGPLAILLRAMPVVVIDLAPGELFEVPRLTSYAGPLGVVMGKQGGLSGPGVEQSITLALGMPDASERRQHWKAALNPDPAKPSELDELNRVGQRFRITSGNIRRAARMARSYAALDGRTFPSLADAQQACRALNRQALDALATHVPPLTDNGEPGNWSQLAVSGDAMSELRALESRCLNRERLPGAMNPALGSRLNAGVRALFTGSSGTGKTLAARVLASALNMDLYRLDLSSVVNKYIGETEKNLNQVFARAEELDVILLLDEGDALMTNRTNVSSSNDRYANLETNFLLQRLEAYEGILIVTTNAGERIDGAFQRRMDVVIEFRPPDPQARHAIWLLHLPAAHAIDAALLDEVAQRCSLTGGQIRNAALHASLLAVNNGGIVTAEYMEAAVLREYRKLGAVCPLRRPNGA